MKEFNTIFFEKSKIVDCGTIGNNDLSKFVHNQGKEIDFFEFVRTDKKLILVVGAGMSAEREVSLMSSNGIVKSLLELQYSVIFVDMGSDIAQVVQAIKPDIVYNALHGTYGEDGCLPGMLNILKVPYTGPGVLASALAMNKKKSYYIFKANQINVTETIIVSKNANIKNEPMARPYVIKPIAQGSSIGVNIIFEEDDFSFADYEFKYGNEVIVEKYIKGREIQVAVLNGKAMGVMEIKLLQGKRFYDYETKYSDGFAQHIFPAQINDAAYKSVIQIAENACEIFDCTEGIIRVEFIYNEEENKFYILEINSHPGMTPLSICPEIVSYAGINYTELVKQIVDNAKFE